MKDTSTESMQQCGTAVTAISLILKRAITASESVRRELNDDVTVAHHNTVQAAMNTDNYSLNMDYEQELLQLREELHAELRKLLSTLVGEYLRHKDLIESLSRRLESLCSIEAKQVSGAPSNQPSSDLPSSFPNIHRPEDNVIAAAADAIIEDLILQHAPNLYLDLTEIQLWGKRASLPVLIGIVNRLILQYTTTELTLSEITQVLNSTITSINDLKLSFELLNSHLTRDAFRLVDISHTNLPRGKDASIIEPLCLALLYWLTELILKAKEKDSQIEAIFCADRMSDDATLKDLMMQLQVIRADNTSTLLSESALWEVEDNLECRKAELLVESCKEASVLLIEKDRYVQEINKLLMILLSILHKNSSLPCPSLNEPLLSDLVSSKLALQRIELEKQLLACSTSSVLLKKLIILHVMRHYGYSSSLDVWSVPLGPHDSQLVEREYLSAQEYSALANLHSDHSDYENKAFLMKLIAELTEDLDAAKQLLDGLSLNMCIPEIILDKTEQSTDPLYSLSDLDCFSSLDVIRKPLMILSYEESIPQIVGLKCRCGSHKGSSNRVTTLTEDLQAMILDHISDQEVSFLSATQYTARTTMKELSELIQSRLQLFKTIWEDLLEIAGKRKEILKNIKGFLSGCIDEVSSTVADSSQKLSLIVKDALLHALKLLSASPSANMDLLKIILNKLKHQLEEFEVKCMHSSCELRFDLLGETLSIESVLDEFIEKAQLQYDMVISRAYLTVTWTKLICLKECWYPRPMAEPLLIGHKAHCSSIHSAIEHFVTPIAVRQALLDTLDALALQPNTDTSLAEDDLHVSGLVISRPTPHLTASIKDSKKTASSVCSVSSTISAASSLACKVAADVLAPDASEKGYISALQMSQYAKVSNYAYSAAHSTFATDSATRTKQSTGSLMASQAVYKLGTGVKARQHDTLFNGYSEDVDTSMEHGTIHYFDENYDKLYVVKALGSLRRPEVRMLEYLFGYMKRPHHVLYWTAKALHFCDCAVYLSTNLQAIVITHCEKTICSISSRSLVAVTENPLKMHPIDKATRFLSLVLSTSNKGDLMLLFTEERGAVVFKVGLQTLVRHRNNLSRLAIVSQCE